MASHRSLRTTGVLPMASARSSASPTPAAAMGSTSNMASPSTSATPQCSRTSLRLHDTVLTSGNDFYDDGYNEVELDTEVPSSLFGNRRSGSDDGNNDGNNDGNDDGRDGMFGREEELRTLHHTFKQMIHNSKSKRNRDRKGTAQKSSVNTTLPSQTSMDVTTDRSFVPAAFVWGTSGTGKSKLVDVFCDQLLQTTNTRKGRGVRVLKGKFQEHQQGNPFSAITQALSDWCKQLTPSHSSLTPIKEVGSGERYEEMSDDDDEDVDVDVDMDADGHPAKTADDHLKTDKQQHHSSSHSSELQRLRSIIRSSKLTMQQKEVLVAFVPALSILLNDDDDNSVVSIASSNARYSHLPQASSTDTSWNQFQYTFTQLLTLISSKHHPVVMVMDDLQWASQECMNLMSTAMYQPHFLWIGTIRQEIDPQCLDEVMELDADLPFMRLLDDMRLQCATASSGPMRTMTTPYTDIHLQNFSKEALRDWVSQLFDQDDDVVDETTKLLHEQTAGNIFHTIHLLQDMERTKALTYSRITFQWEIDASRLSCTPSNNNTNNHNISDGMGGSSHAAANGVVQLITSRLRSLPVPLQRALVLASYIRSSFELGVLQAVWDYEAQHNSTGGDVLATPGGKVNEADAGKSLAEWLEQAVLEGLLANSIGAASYRFAHDRIQQATRDLVPFGEARMKLRLRIGQCLWDFCTNTTSSSGGGDSPNTVTDRGSDSGIFFIAADHLNCAPTKDHLTSTRRNLQVGEHALQIAALAPAATYLQLANTALRKVKGNLWQDYYDLTIRLMRARCDVELSLSRFDLGYSLGNAVLEHARSAQDKLPTYIAIASALGRQDDHAKGLQLAQEGAQICGEYPKRWFAFHGISQLLSVRAYLKRTTVKQFFEQNPITDNPQTLLSMHLLKELGIRAYSCQDIMAWMVATMRTMQMTRRDGICEYSAGALISFAMIQAGLGEFADARKSAELAKEMTLRVGRGTRTEGWIYYTVAMYVDSFFKPWSEVSQDFQYAYTSAMAAGDVELSVLILNANVMFSFFDGRPLPFVVPAARSLFEHMEIYKVDVFRGTRDELFLLCNCMQNTIEVEWETLMDVNKYEHTNPFERTSAYWGRLYIAVYFGKFEYAEKMDHLLTTNGLDDQSFPFVTSVPFLCGLMASHRYRQTKKKKYLKMLRQRKRELKNMCDQKGISVHYLYLILRAEWKAIKVGATSSALVDTCYDNAIMHARAGNHLDSAGLASELAGKQLLRRSGGKDPRIRGYFTQALGFYERWGSVPKAKSFREEYGDYVDEDRVRKMKMDNSLVGQIKSIDLRDQSQEHHSHTGHTQDLMSHGTPGNGLAQSVSDMISKGQASKDPTARTPSDDNARSNESAESAVDDDNMSQLADSSQ